MGICFSSSTSVDKKKSPASSGQFNSEVGSSTSVTTLWSSSATGGSISTISGNSSKLSSKVLSSSGSSSAIDDHVGGQMMMMMIGNHMNPRLFSFSELKSATRNFRNDTVLGEGGFGKVYKGSLVLDKDKNGSAPSTVAVKKLNSESMQGLEEWRSEVNFLGTLSHPNLVKLLGYCGEEEELLLVYEFMQKGSLENHLFGRGSAAQPLPWDIRLKILIGAGRGLAYLHSLDRKVIYRDFKASNILLDGSYHPKISDFGLAKIGPTASKSHLTTQVMGTHGYAAPEYVATGHLYVKSDVYGFGVVLVEMLTGLRAHDPNRPNGQHNLVDWIKPHLSDRKRLKKVMDSRLEGRYPSRSALRIAQLAITCLENEPKKRPSMQEIVEALELIESANERPQAPRGRYSSNYAAANQRLQNHQYRSPLHPRQEAAHRAYPLPPRA